MERCWAGQVRGSAWCLRCIAAVRGLHRCHAANEPSCMGPLPPLKHHQQPCRTTCAACTKQHVCSMPAARLSGSATRWEPLSATCHTHALPSASWIKPTSADRPLGESRPRTAPAPPHKRAANPALHSPAPPAGGGRAMSRQLSRRASKQDVGRWGAQETGQHPGSSTHLCTAGQVVAAKTATVQHPAPCACACGQLPLSQASGRALAARE